MFIESIKMSWQNISNNKMRSFLTTLGIIIGVTAIISLITIVQGLQTEITSQFAELGAGKIAVQAHGTPLKQGLSDNDMENISKIENVAGVSPNLTFISSAVKDGIVLENVPVEGKNHTFFRYNPKLVSRGRPFNILDMESKNKICIINYAVSQKLFFGEDPIGQTMQIGGTTYEVKGVINEDATSDVMSLMSGTGSDYRIIIPYTTAMGMAGIGSITSFEIYVADTDRTDEVIDETESILNQTFNFKDDSYRIINLDSLLDTMNTMNDMMTAVLAGIASIALLVGGIGIMNMMLVSVSERTTEIGLRKALGAEPVSIQIQFLIESIFLSLLGGFLGLVLGLTISYVACIAIGMTFRISYLAIFLGVGFSAAVGIIFGCAPARKASLLNPIDALRSL